MPIVDDRSFLPPAEDAILWRYSAFWKFADLIGRRALFFARATHLGDRFEGTFPRLSLDQFRALAEAWAPKEPDRLYEFLKKTRADFRPYHFISCWSRGEFDSAAAWKFYTEEAAAVAVRTNLARLRRALAASPRHISVGQVSYIEFQTAALADVNTDWLPYLAKRKSSSSDTRYGRASWTSQRMEAGARSTIRSLTRRANTLMSI